MRQLTSFLIILFFAGAAAAQDRDLQVTYPKFTSERIDVISPLEQDLMAMQGIQHFEVRLISPKWHWEASKLVCHRVEDGKPVDSEELVVWDWAITSERLTGDTISIRLLAQPLGADSVGLWLGCNNSIQIPVRLRFPEVNRLSPIWLETYVKATESSKQIPIIAFTPGIMTKTTFYGQEGTLVDYCGLRDAELHPRYWAGELGIQNYVYFTIEFQE